VSEKNIGELLEVHSSERIPSTRAEQSLTRLSDDSDYDPYRAAPKTQAYPTLPVLPTQEPTVSLS